MLCVVIYCTASYIQYTVYNSMLLQHLTLKHIEIDNQTIRKQSEIKALNHLNTEYTCMPTIIRICYKLISGVYCFESSSYTLVICNVLSTCIQLFADFIIICFVYYGSLTENLKTNGILLYWKTVYFLYFYCYIL